MPFSISEEDGQYKVINSDTGDVKGEHKTQADAEDQLAALYSNVADADSEPQPDQGDDHDFEDIEQPTDLKKARREPGPYKRLYIPITKVDQERHEVWGFAALEQPDHSQEIMDYQTSKPNFQKWSQAAEKRSQGRSKGNVRSMHSDVASGKLIHFEPDDPNQGIYVGAKVVDPNEWKKVEEGVYTGFSVGGHYGRRWPDFKNPGYTRYTAEPVEISLVDAPSMPGAVFDMVKADGLVESHKFNPPQSPTQELVLELPEELAKAKDVLPGLPDTPEAITEVDVPQERVARLPDPAQPMLVSPSDPPDGATLASRHNATQVLKAAAAGAGEGHGAINQQPSDLGKADSQACSECGHDCPAGCKFCPECGHKLAMEGGEGEEELQKTIRVKPRRMIKVRGLTDQILAKWDEADHPRAADGKFGSGGGGGGKGGDAGSGSKKQPAAQAAAPNKSNQAGAGKPAAPSSSPKGAGAKAGTAGNQPTPQQAKQIEQIQSQAKAQGKAKSDQAKAGIQTYPAFNAKGEPTRVTIPGREDDAPAGQTEKDKFFASPEGQAAIKEGQFKPEKIPQAAREQAMSDKEKFFASPEGQAAVKEGQFKPGAAGKAKADTNPDRSDFGGHRALKDQKEYESLAHGGIDENQMQLLHEYAATHGMKEEEDYYRESLDGQTAHDKYKSQPSAPKKASPEKIAELQHRTDTDLEDSLTPEEHKTMEDHWKSQPGGLEDGENFDQAWSHAASAHEKTVGMRLPDTFYTASAEHYKNTGQAAPKPDPEGSVHMTGSKVRRGGGTVSYNKGTKTYATSYQENGKHVVEAGYLGGKYPHDTEQRHEFKDDNEATHFAAEHLRGKKPHGNPVKPPSYYKKSQQSQAASAPANTTQKAAPLSTPATPGRSGQKIGVKP